MKVWLVMNHYTGTVLRVYSTEDEAKSYRKEYQQKNGNTWTGVEHRPVHGGIAEMIDSRIEVAHKKCNGDLRRDIRRKDAGIQQALYALSLVKKRLKYLQK